MTHPLAIERFKKALEEARNAALKPPPTMTVPDWADAYRHLSSASGAFAGEWSTARVEVARGPMMAVTEPGVTTITAMTCTQLLKTSLLENIIGFYAHLDPCPILLTQPKDEAVKAFSKERIVPMVEVTPVLRSLMKDKRTRNSDDTMSFKRFPGGFLAMVSAGSPTNLAMRAIRVTLQDEVDKYEPTKEGDPIILAEERTATFGDSALKVRTCSPTLEETSRIYHSYLSGDQRRPFVTCPHCQSWISLDFFKHVQWHKDEEGAHYPETAAIYCSECGAAWSETERLRAVTTKYGIRHLQTRPFICCGTKQDPQVEKLWHFNHELQVGYALCKLCGKRAVPNNHASFTASKLYSPFTTVREIAQKWIDARKDPEQRQTFYNTILGRPFKAQISKALGVNELMARCELYPAEVPLKAVVITYGIDVQSTGRFEVEAVAWGAGEESWSLDHKIIEGDLNLDGPWKELDEYLRKPWKHELGFDMYLSGACMDSGGHHTQKVYVFAQQRAGLNLWAVKGASDKTSQWSPTWPLAKVEKWRNTGTKPIIVGVSSAKEIVRSRLLIQEKGPGYCHFPVGRSEAWFDQLDAENLIMEKHGGEFIRRWQIKRGRANEALDCRVYAYAALQGLYFTRQFDLDKQVRLFENYANRSKDQQAAPSKVSRNKWVGGE